jgi:hypothetical protein
LKKTHHKNRTGRVAQGEGPEFKSQYLEKKKIEGWSFLSKFNTKPSTVAHICNPSYLRGRDWEDCGLKPAQANS